MALGWLVPAVAVLGTAILTMVLVYRMAGIRPGSLERRRMTVMISMLAAFVILLAALFAVRAPGVHFYWVPVAAAMYLWLRQLQKRGHWLLTPTAEEQAALPARREAVNAVMRRPAFWVLVLGLGASIVVVSIGAALIMR